MGNIEKIRKFVKELQQDFISIQPKDCSLDLIKSYAGYAYLDKVLSFLDTLESEKPMNQDGLEEEMDKFFEMMPVLEHENIFEETFHNIARHFAEWGAEHLRDSTKMIGKSLDGAANEFANQDCVTFISRKKGFIAGAKWQKEQMMKEAVEGTITCYNDDTYAVESCCLDNKEHHHHSGDKVRIVVLKEEE